MPLTRWERKARLGHGAVSEIARREKQPISVVSEVLNGRRRNRKVEVAIARRLRMRHADVFPPRDEEIAAAVAV